MRIEGKTTGKDIKKAVTFGSNCFVVSGATSNINVKLLSI